MPLIKSGSRAAVSQNISEMVHAGHPQKQAVAAALSNARKYGRAEGGGVPTFYERNLARSLPHQGFIHSPVPGRTDKLPISVSGGAYVLPADHVAALGQGNSIAGANIVNKMFKMGPYGASQMPMHQAKAPMPHLNLTPKTPHFDEGGATKGVNPFVGMPSWNSGQEPPPPVKILPSATKPTKGLPAGSKFDEGGARNPRGAGKPTPIIAAGGEIVIPPDKIVAKFGDLEHGHKALDEWVVRTRKKHIKQLRGLKPPKKD
jgi:hypothetical protein